MVGTMNKILVDNPIHRFRAYLVSRGWWSEPEESALLSKTKADVLRAFARAEKLPKPKLGEMFNDVWAVKEGEEVPTVIVSKESGYVRVGAERVN